MKNVPHGMARQFRFNQSIRDIKMFRRLRQYFVMQKTIQELETLTNKELFDIGITRGDIPTIARKMSKHGR